MKRSNKILLGGLSVPILICIGFIIFMTLNSTNDPFYQLGETSHMNFGSEWHF